jgi:hypothetical protein
VMANKLPAMYSSAKDRTLFSEYLTSAGRQGFRVTSWHRCGHTGANRCLLLHLTRWQG